MSLLYTHRYEDCADAAEVEGGGVDGAWGGGGAWDGRVAEGLMGEDARGPHVWIGAGEEAAVPLLVRPMQMAPRADAGASEARTVVVTFAARTLAGGEEEVGTLALRVTPEAAAVDGSLRFWGTAGERWEGEVTLDPEDEGAGWRAVRRSCGGGADAASAGDAVRHKYAVCEDPKVRRRACSLSLSLSRARSLSLSLSHTHPHTGPDTSSPRGARQVSVLSAVCAGQQRLRLRRRCGVNGSVHTFHLLLVRRVGTPLDLQCFGGLCVQFFDRAFFFG